MCARAHVPNVRLLGWTWLGLSTYLYSGLEFPTLGHSWHKDSMRSLFSLSPLAFFPPLLSRLSWCLLCHLSLTSNFKSLISLHNRSISWSLSLNCPCLVAPDIVWCVWYDSSLRSNCSSSRSHSLSSHLFCLYPRYMDPREDPTDPLLAWSAEHPSDIFPVREFLLNHSFVRDSHRWCQLCFPNVRLLGWTWLGLTTYLYGRLKFPTLSRSWHRDSMRSLFSLSPSAFFPPPILSFPLTFIAN